MIDDDTVGFLKFTEPDYLITTYNGTLHFCDPLDFLKSDDKAQKDNEGSAVNIYIKNKQTSADYGLIKIQSAMRIQFNKRNFAKFYEVFPMDIDLNNIEESVKAFNHVLISEVARKNHPLYYYDLFIRPTKYNIDLGNNGISVEKAKVLFNERSSYNGLITSFITLKRSDFRKNGTISEKLINEVVDYNNKDTSIAFLYDANENKYIERPWVWIPRSEMIRMIEQTKQFDLIARELLYYNTIYPYSVNQLRSVPGLNLFAKKDSYSSQREFRLLYGGPNSDYNTLPVNNKGNYTFNWNKEVIKSGSLAQLSNSTFNI